MLIVFDTNVWLAELALNTQAGAAVRFFVQQQDATVVVPEVVRLELERNLAQQLRGLAQSIREDHGRLLTVFGSLKDIILPTDEEIDQRVSEILSQLDVRTNDVPLTLGAARASFLKCIDKLPPSDRNQQFKDGAIWAACVELVAQDDVFLVTGDKAFYAERQYERGLAPNLAAEIAACDHTIHLLPDLAQLLDGIKIDYAIDTGKLVDAFLESQSSTLNRMLDESGFALGENPLVNASLFVTESASRLYVEFTIEYRCPDVSGQDRADARLAVSGDGAIDTSTGAFEGLRSRGEELEYTDSDGEHKSTNVVLGAASVVMGHRTVVHKVKYPLQ